MKDSDDKKNLSNELKKQPELKGTNQINDNDKVETANKQINHSTAILNSIFEGPENIIAFSLDRNYQYIFFNQTHSQTMKNIWGVDIETGKNMLDYISYPEDRQKAKINFDRVFSGENFIEIEKYGEETLSRMYWENIYNPIQSGDDIIGLTVFCIDITERQKSAENLRQSEEKFRAVAESAIDAIITADSNGIITFFNHSLLELFGYSASELSGKPVSILIPPEHKNGHVKGMKSFKSGEVHRTGKTSLAVGLKKDGTKFPCEMSISSWKSGENTYFTSIIRDLTERKKIEDALIHAKEEWEHTFHAVPDLIAILDTNFRIVRVNKAMADRLSVDPEEAIGIHCYKAIHGLDEPPSFCPLRKLLEDGQEHTIEVHEDRIGGDFIVSVSPIHDSEGKLMGVVHVARDITERKRGEEALKESEEKFRLIFDNANDMISLNLMNNDGMPGRFLEVNDLASERLGYTRDEMLNMSPPDIVAPDKRVEMPGNASALIEKGHNTFEIVHLTKDGRRIHVEINNHLITYKGRRVCLAISRDISDRKKAEEALIKSEEKYRTIFENVQDVFFQTDIKGKIIEISPSVERYFGIKPNELVGRHVDMLYLNPDDRKTLLKVLQEKGEVSDYEITLRGIEKELVYISANVHFILDSSNQPIGIEGVLRDITGRKLVEESLKNSEAEYRAIFENSKSAVAVYNAVDNGSNFIFKDFNQAAEKIEQIKRENVIGRKITEVFPGVVEFGIFEVFQRVWRTGKPGKLPVSIYKDERIWGWRENYVYKLPSGDIVTVYDDLTEIKQYEEELEKNQSRLKSLVRILQYRGESVEEFFDYALEEAIQLTESKIGYIAHYQSDKKLFVLNTWSQGVMKDCSISPLPKVFNLDETGLWGEPVRQRKPIILNDFQTPHPLKKGYPEGHSQLYKFMTIPIFSGDEIVAVVAVGNKDTDYTETDVLQLELLMDGVWKVAERQKAEETIKENEKRLKILFEYAPDPYFISNFEGKILDGNKAVEGFIGYKKGEFLGKTVNELNLVSGEESLKVAEAMAKLAQDQYGEPLEFKIKKKDGNVISAETTSFLIEIKGQKMVLIMGRDITERKKAEEALKLSRIRLSNAMDLAHLANWELDPYKQMFIFNDKFYSMLDTTAEIEGGYHMSIEQYIKKYVHPEEAQFIAEGMKKSFASGEPTFGTNFENRIIRRDGEIRFLAIHIRVIPATESHSARVYGAVQDITEHKMAEEKLKESLEEKEMLLKEIHHRVKNNLMVISSLLNLQSQYIKDKEALDIFRESQNRARSMALIHERLYQSTDLKRIDFGDYIRTLANDLFHTYVTDPGKVRLNLNVENLMVDINTTVPLGLIVNELLTNSMKHGFIDGKEGEITINFHKEKDIFVLTVSDTGVGFPEDLDFRNTSTLGLQLVNNLTRQIDGKLELNRDNGTEFKITFEEQYK
nr:PAS domain S-box protein [uncultured Methanobacterium sp.]